MSTGELLIHVYDLTKLRGKNLPHRVERSRRYLSDPVGVCAVCAYLVLCEKK